MKKILLLLLVATFSVVSCSKDDDNSSVDPLIGTWKYYKFFSNEEEFPLDDCEKTSTLKINSNGTFESNYFFDNGTSCESGGVSTGFWENTGNNVYKITSDPETVDEEIGLYTFTFEGNTFSFVETDGTETYTTVYIRS